MQWWTAYWSAPGGRIATGVVRIALALATWLVLDRIAGELPVAQPEHVIGVYHPVGVLLVFSSPPPALVIHLAMLVARAGAIAMVLGLGARIACALTALGALIVCSQGMSYQPTWSHDYNVVLLALLAFQGARSGDALALDLVIARWRGRRTPDDARYQWSLRLIQLAVGLMFLSACVIKLKTGGVRWALSDNLRHQLLARYDLIGETTHPPIVDWLLAASWRYEGAALLNLLSQASPLLAIVFVDRPWLRALAGLCFAIEIVALYEVMQLDDTCWLPLTAVFIDWDRLWHALRRRRPRAPDAANVATRPSRAIARYLAVFVVVDLVVSFSPGLDRKLRAFPFTRFPMFSNVRARMPYGRHQSYDMIAGRVEPIADQPVPPEVQAEIDRDYVLRTLWQATGEALRAQCIAARDRLRQRYPALGVRGIRVYLTRFEAPAYPAPAHLERHDLRVLGELRDDQWNNRDHPRVIQ